MADKNQKPLDFGPEGEDFMKRFKNLVEILTDDLADAQLEKERAKERMKERAIAVTPNKKT